MKLRCKVDDLAIIKGSRFNDGKIVKCVKFVDRDPALPSFKDLWLVDPPVIVYKIINFDGVFEPADGPTNLVPDEFLVPIKGDLLDEEIKEELTEFV